MKNFWATIKFTIFLAAVVAGVGVWRMGGGFFEQAIALFSIQEAEPEVDIQSLIVKQVRDASELTTAIYVMEAVVPTKQEATLGSFTVGTTRLLYLARGEVRAGVDLSQLTPEDVQVLDDRIMIELPAAQIIDHKIDVERSRVYSYDRGFLGLGPDTAPELQSLAQRETLRRVVKAACADGLLQQANNRAGIVVTQLVNLVETEKQIVVQTQNPLSGSCASPVAQIHNLVAIPN
ncbi:hypothetical protein Pse7367_0806 [Thalassoporum mexicanum PCC 7367]|uniref:DUF4230 domain-containing protein n=1 Tax=Thalassoporum mexicanum TaxID=3457544 RepID=UPI00029FE7DA|nr:DUF4230 domain-containing protein [Pseudanabaena sp. PCC 7367]AFY69106.1 hypothetical protein Pse7367_0806 [Pseudanabaena sp. PCC 7367]